MDQNHAQIIVPSEPTYINSQNFIDFAITHNFPFPYSIQVLNELNSDHLPVSLNYDIRTYDIDLLTVLSTRWRQYTEILARKELPSLILDSKLEIEQTIDNLGEILEDAYRARLSQDWAQGLMCNEALNCPKKIQISLMN